MLDENGGRPQKTCNGCGEPANSSLAPLLVTCAGCGLQQSVEGIDSDHELRAPPLLSMDQQSWWDHVATMTEADSPIILKNCEACEAWLTLALDQTVFPTCKGCGRAEEMEAQDCVLDMAQGANFLVTAKHWFELGELKNSLASPGYSLSWRAYVQAARDPEPTTCPACDGEIQAFDGLVSCPHCQQQLFCLRRGDTRVLMMQNIYGFEAFDQVDRWTTMASGRADFLERQVDVQENMNKVVKVGGMVFLGLGGCFFALFLLMGLVFFLPVALKLWNGG